MADRDKTIGQRIDEVLAPFLKDKADLQARLEHEVAQRQKLDAQIQATKRDLQIVEQTMVQALRDAAGHDALLAQAFGATEPLVHPRTEAAASGGAVRSRSHPLLNPTP